VLALSRVGHVLVLLFFFFFQAEDGIRDFHVTGVQTCALPILKKFAALRAMKMPEDALPGSLALCHRRCGKPTCHCAKEKGHPVWMLTYMLDGKKKVERIPNDWVEEVQRRVDAGRKYKDAITEVFNSNAQLLVLWRRQSK